MAKTLKVWLTENPGYNAFPGTVSGKPMIYQTGPAGAPTLTAEDWFVWDWISEFPDLSQSPAVADISTTGSTSRKLLGIVPDAPTASDLSVNLTEDTDAGINAIEELVEAYKTAIDAGEVLYIGHFMGEGKKSQIYQAGVAWTSGLLGAFPDPVTTNVAVTPNLGAYNKYQVITNVGG